MRACARSGARALNRRGKLAKLGQSMLRPYNKNFTEG